MHWIAERLRRLADRIDHKGAPKGLSWSFTIEPGRGVVFNQDGRGCPLWYLGDANYDRAHDEAGAPEPRKPSIAEQLALFVDSVGKPLDPGRIFSSAFTEYNQRMGAINRKP